MSITLKLEGLHCANCVKSVEKALNAVEGVKQATVTLEPQQAVIEGTADVAALIAAVDEMGFEAESA